eukprot:12399708-Karenia_brevis.AAC.1
MSTVGQLFRILRNLNEDNRTKKQQQEYDALVTKCTGYIQWCCGSAKRQNYRGLYIVFEHPWTA